MVSRSGSTIERFELKLLFYSRPDMPGVIDKHQRNIYPTDLLKVAPNQRVKATQATKEVVEALIKVIIGNGGSV